MRTAVLEPFSVLTSVFTVSFSLALTFIFFARLDLDVEDTTGEMEAGVRVGAWEVEGME